MYSSGALQMDMQKQDDQLKPTYSSSVLIRDVALGTCRKQWTIGRGGERVSGISADSVTWWRWLYLPHKINLSVSGAENMLYLLQRGKILLTPPQKRGWLEYDIKLHAAVSYPKLLLVVRIPSLGQIDLFKNYQYWIRILETKTIYNWLLSLVTWSDVMQKKKRLIYALNNPTRVNML